MADAFKELELEDGQSALSAGDAVANLYIVQDGQMEGGEGDDAVYFGRGDFFGELALVLDEPIDMTIKSLGTRTQTDVCLSGSGSGTGSGTGCKLGFGWGTDHKQLE